MAKATIVPIPKGESWLCAWSGHKRPEPKAARLVTQRIGKGGAATGICTDCLRRLNNRVRDGHWWQSVALTTTELKRLPPNLKNGVGHFSLEDGLLTLWDHKSDFEIQFTPSQLRLILTKHK